MAIDGDGLLVTLGLIADRCSSCTGSWHYEKPKLNLLLNPKAHKIRVDEEGEQNVDSSTALALHVSVTALQDCRDLLVVVVGSFLLLLQPLLIQNIRIRHPYPPSP